MIVAAARTSGVCKSLHRGARRGIQSSYGHWIDGKEVASLDEATLEVRSPFDGSLVTTVAQGTAMDVDAEYSRRRRVRRWRWSGSPRQRVLNRAAELLAQRVGELADAERADRPAVKEMRAQLGRLPEWLEHFAAGTGNGGDGATVLRLRASQLCSACPARGLRPSYTLQPPTPDQQKAAQRLPQAIQSS